ncbi:MAG: 2-phospho-L-lactate transferase [Sphingomonadales bacterium]|nr:2-phospho-L-lactate transferase [Sphingomonadales bacterium]
MTGKVVILTGGVGGAKLVLGVAQIVPPADILAIVNTGDDFRHLGLHVSPDIDTLLYTLSGKSNEAQGWGREGESWNFMSALRSLGGEDWFALGDGDLALHVQRSHLLSRGHRLSSITAGFAAAWGIEVSILPMSDDLVATSLDTDQGKMEFQRYFVEQRCVPMVSRIEFSGADTAQPAPGLVDAILQAEAIIIAPSNPYLSVDPILALPAITAALHETGAAIVAVSPIIGGKAVKGPTAKLMTELGIRTDNAAIATHYKGIIDGLVIDVGDDAPDGIAVERTDTLMTTLDDGARVARVALDLARSIGRR